MIAELKDFELTNLNTTNNIKPAHISIMSHCTYTHRQTPKLEVLSIA